MLLASNGQGATFFSPARLLTGNGDPVLGRLPDNRNKTDVSGAAYVAGPS